MRGRTNIASSGEAVVNGILKDYEVAPESTIGRGDFVSLYTQKSETPLVGQFESNGVKKIRTIKYDENKYIYCNNFIGIAYLIDTSNGISVLSSYVATSSSLAYVSVAMLADKTILINSTGTIHVLQIIDDQFILQNTINTGINIQDIFEYTDNQVAAIVYSSSYYYLHIYKYEDGEFTLLIGDYSNRLTENSGAGIEGIYGNVVVVLDSYYSSGNSAYIITAVINETITKKSTVNLSYSSGAFGYKIPDPIGNADLLKEGYFLLNWSDGIQVYKVSEAGDIVKSFTLELDAAPLLGLSFSYNSGNITFAAVVTTILYGSSSTVTQIVGYAKINLQTGVVEILSQSKEQINEFTAYLLPKINMAVGGCVGEYNKCYFISPATGNCIRTSVSNEVLYMGEETNYVESYNGGRAIGFAKTGGTAGETIKVYVPPET